MGILVNLFEMLTCNMGVNLGSGEVGMAEQLFDGLNIASFIQDMGSEAVTEHVRADSVGIALPYYKCPAR